MFGKVCIPRSPLAIFIQRHCVTKRNGFTARAAVPYATHAVSTSLIVLREWGLVCVESPFTAPPPPWSCRAHSNKRERPKTSNGHGYSDAFTTRTRQRFSDDLSSAEECRVDSDDGQYDACMHVDADKRKAKGVVVLLQTLHEPSASTTSLLITKGYLSADNR
jgi:hypothetical protein